MNNSRIDIELIAKYYNGELDSKAMQELEERALEDPFLADAMDGFSEFSIQKNDFIDIDERLKDRLRKQHTKRIGSFGFRNWAIAASVVILIGFISIYLNLPEENKTIPVDQLPQISDMQSFDKKTPEEQQNKDSIIDKQIIIDESPVVVNLSHKTSDANKESISSDEIILQPFISNDYKPDSTKKEVLIAANSNKTIDGFADNSLNVAAARSSSQPMLSKMSTNQSSLVKGKVIDSEDKSPLVGVKVFDINTGLYAITDTSGEFKILVEPNAKLSLSYLGYTKKELEVLDRDSLNISLNPDNNSLAEVAVVGYGSVKKHNAGPKDGWASFRKYLGENNELESGEAGAVVVEFVINSNGGLSDFKIVKSLSKLADARAIYLIRNYSEWRGASDGTANKAKVTLRFK